MKLCKNSYLEKIRKLCCHDNQSFLKVLAVLLQVTGSGKTLAFVIPIIELLLKREEKLKKKQVTMTPKQNNMATLVSVVLFFLFGWFVWMLRGLLSCRTC